MCKCLLVLTLHCGMAREGGTEDTHRAHRSTRRLLLVDGFDDPFITCVARDIASAALDLDIETVVLGEERGETHPFLRVSRHAVGRKVQGIAAPVSLPNGDIDLEVAFRETAGMRGRSRARVGLQLSAWRREAQLALESVSPDVVIVWNGLLQGMSHRLLNLVE